MRLSNRSANQPTEWVSPVPRLMVMPSMSGASAAAMKPATVSLTKVMSRSGVSEPSVITSRRERLGDDRRDEGPRALARAERVERPQRDDRRVRNER